MEKAKELEGMSLNYKINGEICSFMNTTELVKHLNFLVVDLRKTLEVEPLDQQGLDYDHMQEIMGLTYKASGCIKGIDAIAECIQRHGTFTDYHPDNITWLGIMCKQLLDELMDIADASMEVYEGDWAKRREERGALQAQPVDSVSHGK